MNKQPRPAGPRSAARPAPDKPRRPARGTGKGASRGPARVKTMRGNPGTVHALLGIALAPVALLLALGVARAASAVLPCGEVRPFLYGLAVYAALHLLFFRPLFLHVVEHEFTHALFAKLTFGRVYAMHIASDDEGSVTMSKQNALISLAPYFFPLFASCALAVHRLAHPPYRPALAFAAGTLLACHLLMTLRDLKVRQPDLEVAGGRMLAIPLLAIGQGVFFALFLHLLSHGELTLADILEGARLFTGR